MNHVALSPPPRMYMTHHVHMFTAVMHLDLSTILPKECMCTVHDQG